MNFNKILPGLKDAVITRVKKLMVITIYIISYQKRNALKVFF
mgnify:CR=1 FL=1|jgi:hypothetical protein